MLPSLKEASYRGDYRIWLKFADGVEGEIDLESELWGEMFEPLKDKTRFGEFVLNEELGTIVWPNGADLSSELLYQSVCEGCTQESQPGSMEAAIASMGSWMVGNAPVLAVFLFPRSTVESRLPRGYGRLERRICFGPDSTVT